MKARIAVGLLVESIHESTADEKTAFRFARVRPHATRKRNSSSRGSTIVRSMRLSYTTPALLVAYSLSRNSRPRGRPVIGAFYLTGYSDRFCRIVTIESCVLAVWFVSHSRTKRT